MWTSSGAPMQLAYMRALRRALHYLGAWPAAARALPLRHHRFLFCFWATLLVIQILYIRDNIHRLSFFELGHNYITIMMTVVDVQRITMPSTRVYREVTRMFVHEVHLLHHRHRSEYAMQVHQQVHNISKFICYVFHFLIVITVLFFNLTPLINNYRAGMYGTPRPPNGTFDHSAYYKLPFDYEHDVTGYIAMLIFNLILTFDVGCVFAFFDAYLIIIVFHTWGHLKILDHDLRNFPRPAVTAPADRSGPSPSMYSPEESDRVARMLKQNIEHHKLIKNFVGNVSSGYGLMIFVYYAFHQLSGCILLLECSSLDPAALIEYLPLTVCMFAMQIEMSVIFELVGSKSDTLSDAVYSVPWECMRARERRTLLVFLANVQTPISLKALGVVPVGVRTMAQIFKTSVTYFLMLRTLAATK